MRQSLKSWILQKKLKILCQNIRCRFGTIYPDQRWPDPDTQQCPWAYIKSYISLQPVRIFIRYLKFPLVLCLLLLSFPHLLLIEGFQLCDAQLRFLLAVFLWTWTRRGEEQWYRQNKANSARVKAISDLCQFHQNRKRKSERKIQVDSDTENPKMSNKISTIKLP